jgi:NADH-quinone oxidoreductase subunit G
VFEKSGTFVNQQFRLQKFAKAVPGPAGVADDLTSLAELIAVAGGGIVSFDLSVLWSALATEVPVLAGLSYAKLDSLGQALDAAAWAGLPFCEGETLHFKPAAVPAAANA